MPAPSDCPRLRPGLAIVQDDMDPRHVYLCDQLRLTTSVQRLSLTELVWVRLFDGERTLTEIQAEALRQLGGKAHSLELLAAFVRKLDEDLFLDSPRFRTRLSGPVREPSCIGCYAGEPGGLRRQLHGMFTADGGPGLPQTARPSGTLRAALVPHIDYQRGGVSYAWGFKEVFEHTHASLFVILGTSHYSTHRFTLTRQDFKTPLGIARTDQAYIDRLVRHYGNGLFDDPLAHVPEHSIELEVVFLQYLYEGKRPFRIVPLVVGSFHDCVLAGSAPHARTDIGRMVEALRRAEEETPEPICYLISGDLAHLGPKFGDRLPVEERGLRQSRAQDEALLRHAEAVDPAGYFRVIAEEGDRRRICGLPPTYTVLEAIRPARGKLLHYGQYVHPRGHESVSFASVGFYA